MGTSGNSNEPNTDSLNMTQRSNLEAGVRSFMRTSINRSAHWLSDRTGDAGASADDGLIDLSQDVEWVDQGITEDQVFDAKLDAFLELEVGNARERRWLLNGPNSAY